MAASIDDITRKQNAKYYEKHNKASPTQTCTRPSLQQHNGKNVCREQDRTTTSHRFGKQNCT